MTLRLELRLPRSRVSLGSEVALVLTLFNDGDAPVELASLFNNNTITNYVLTDADDREIVRVNHVTRQLLFEKTEPRTHDEKIHTLAAGGSEQRADNFCRYHWLERPGTYHLRGLYRFRDIELLSAPVRFEVEAAPLSNLDTVWLYHYGEKFLLYSAWIAEAEAAGRELVLRESARFRPQVINYNRVLARPGAPIAPRVAFHRSLLAGNPTWLSWLEGQELVCQLASEGQTSAGPFRFRLPGANLRQVLQPIANADGSLCLLLDWDPGAPQLFWLKVARDGSELGRAAFPLPASALLLRGVCDENGGYRLLWFSAATGQLCTQALDLDQGVPSGQVTAFGQLANAPRALLVPPVLGSEGYVCSVSTLAQERAVEFAWWSLFEDGSAGPAKVTRAEVPEAAQVLDISGELNAQATPFVLVRSHRLLRYVNGSLQQSLEVLKDAELDPAATERLVITPRNDVYLVTSRPGVGLTERRLHRGTEFDLSEIVE